MLFRSHGRSAGIVYACLDDACLGQRRSLHEERVRPIAKVNIFEACIDDPSGTPVSAYITNTGDWERFGVFPIVLHNRLHGRHHVYLTVKAPTPKMDGQTTIYAQFAKGVDPNKEQVEVTVRPEVFYPDHTGVDYITVRGFTLQNAATNWAPPSAEQPGLIGPHWAKGWIIEHNTICRSRCSGISLGRSTYGHAHHYQYLPPRIYEIGRASCRERV